MMPTCCSNIGVSWSDLDGFELLHATLVAFSNDFVHFRGIADHASSVDKVLSGHCDS